MTLVDMSIQSHYGSATDTASEVDRHLESDTHTHKLSALDGLSHLCELASMNFTYFSRKHS